jgi:hypothetical protein
MATYYYDSTALGTGDGGSWVNARTSLQTMSGGSGTVAAGDTLLVADTHAENAGAAAITITAPGTPAAPNYILCVNKGTGLLSTGASVTNTGNFAINLNGCFYCYAVNFNAGSGSSSSGTIQLAQGATGFWQKYEQCTFTLVQTGNPAVNVGRQPSAGSGNLMEWINCRVSFAAVGQTIQVNSGDFVWRNDATMAAAITGAAVPTNLFTTSTGGGNILCEGLDLSAMAAGKNLIASGVMAYKFYFNNCRLAANLGAVQTTPTSLCMAAYVNASGSAATTYRQEAWNYLGNQTTDTVVARTGGASDGTTLFSWRLTTTANVVWAKPYNSLLVSQWNTTTGSAATFVMRGIINAATILNNDEVWLNVQYLGNASYPLANVVNTSKANILATGAAVTADTSAWDTGAPARVNGETVAVGAIRRLGTGSNPGRVFFCTAITTGVLATPEPGGYASAVDGGSVTDGGATFRAGWRFVLSYTTAGTTASPHPALVGPVYAWISFARASMAANCWIDPQITPS